MHLETPQEKVRKLREWISRFIVNELRSVKKRISCGRVPVGHHQKKRKNGHDLHEQYSFIGKTASSRDSGRELEVLKKIETRSGDIAEPVLHIEGFIFWKSGATCSDHLEIV